MCLLYVCCEKREEKEISNTRKRHVLLTPRERKTGEETCTILTRETKSSTRRIFPSYPFRPLSFSQCSQKQKLYFIRDLRASTRARLSRFSTLRAPMIYFPIIYVLPPTRIPGTARVDRSRVGRSAWRIQGVGGAGARARYPESLVADARQRETGSKVIQRRKERSVTDLAGVREAREKAGQRERGTRSDRGGGAEEKRRERREPGSIRVPKYPGDLHR